MASSKGLISGFLNSVDKFPNQPALYVDKQYYTYSELSNVALSIGHAILTNEKEQEPFAAFLGYRSMTAYASILGILASGKGYVPLNPTFPNERILTILGLSSCNVVVIASESIKFLPDLLASIDRPLTLIFPDGDETNEYVSAYPQHQFVVLDKQVEKRDTITVADVDNEAAAYLLFTSGSTGTPKGVAISHANALDYIHYTCNRYEFNEYDRFGQTADMSFDLSILEIHPCWASASCLYCLPKNTVMAPAKFIKDNKLTVWISVPSVGIIMSKMRLLKANAFPSLRYCLFDGEPLLANIASLWQQAASNAVIENLYGPTEATVAITNYTWDEERSPAICNNGVVPIGWTFDTQKSCIIDEDTNVVSQGEKGELCLAGSQLTKGYFNDVEKTQIQFITIPSTGSDTWYRTGDLVRQDKNGCMHYLGRIDNQIKILGYRIELQEIDSVLRQASQNEMATSIAWPYSGIEAQGIVAFIPGRESDEEKNKIMDYCKNILPGYMVPSSIIFIDSMPLSSNGKTDRLALRKFLEQEKQ